MLAKLAYAAISECLISEIFMNGVTELLSAHSSKTFNVQRMIHAILILMLLNKND